MEDKIVSHMAIWVKSHSGIPSQYKLWPRTEVGTFPDKIKTASVY